MNSDLADGDTDRGFIELPDFDTVGGTMVAVQENMARLTPEDRDAIAAYLKSLPTNPPNPAAGATGQ